MNNQEFVFDNEQFNELHVPPAQQDIEKRLSGHLSSDELMRAKEISEQFKPSSYESALSFGRSAQLKIQQFSSSLMQATRKADPQKVQNILEEMANQIERINPDNLSESSGNFFKKIFQAKRKRSMQQTISEYRKLSKYVDRLAIQLKHAQQELFMQQRQLNALFDENAFHFQEISIHIRAAQMKAAQLKHQTIDNIQIENNLFGQVLNDHNNMIEWVDQILYNLQLSQEVARQSAFQIRMVQQTNQMLIEKVQTSIMVTIPLWQSQIATILSIGNQKRASKMQESFSKKEGSITRHLNDARERVQMESERSGANQITTSNIEQFKATQLRLLDEIEAALKLEVNQDKT